VDKKIEEQIREILDSMESGQSNSSEGEETTGAIKEIVQKIVDEWDAETKDSLAPVEWMAVSTLITMMINSYPIATATRYMFDLGRAFERVKYSM